MISVGWVSGTGIAYLLDMTIQEFLHTIENDNTRIAYAADLRFLENVEPSMAYIRAHLKRRHVVDSAATMRRRSGSIRAFLRWAGRDDIADRMTTPKVPSRVPRVVSGDWQVEGPLVVQAAVAVMKDSGARVSELLALEVADVDLVEGWAGRFPIGTATCRVLSDWLVERGLEDGVLFRGLYRKKLQRAMAKAGVTARSVRNTVAATLLERGADLRSVQVLMGHSSVNVTKRYSRANPEWLAQEHGKVF